MLKQHAYKFESVVNFLKKRVTFNALSFRFRRIEFVRYHLGLKGGGFMRTIAKWFFVAMATATQRYRRASGKIEFIAGGVKNFKLAFDANVAVVVDGNFRGHRNLFAQLVILFRRLLALYFSIAFLTCNVSFMI